MKCKIKLLVVATVLLVGNTAIGDVSITDVTARQRYPWNGKVDISYSATGIETKAKEAGLMVSLKVAAIDQDAGTTNIATTLSGDMSLADGVHKIVWDMKAQGLDVKSTNVVFFVACQSEKTKYCIVDLSAGSAATSYPVSYTNEIPGGSWSDEYKTTKLVFRRINAGVFTMGSPIYEVGRLHAETQHQVTLTTDYWMGVFPVTQRQWELVVNTRPSYFGNTAYYEARPVEQVSYDMIRGASEGSRWPSSSAIDQVSFLGVLRAKTDLMLDLPTEAQWEYACRAGTTTALNSGKNLTSTSQDSEMDNVGRYWYDGGGDGSGRPECDLSKGTAKVGSYKPNAWGIYDMHGNVREWCLDWLGDYSGDVTDPVGPSSPSFRVLRGGCWRGTADRCRSASRYDSNPSDNYNDHGFRLACTTGLSQIDAKGFSRPARIDLTSGARTTERTETITYSTAWADGVGAGATAVVSVDGQIISEAHGSGTVDWTPPQNGTYALAHQVIVGGVPAGETLTATFMATNCANVVFTSSGYDGIYDGTGHGIGVDVTDPAEGAVVTYSLAEEGEFKALPILFTNVTDSAQSVYFKITAPGYRTANGVETVRITPKALTGDMIGAIADRVYTGEAHRPEVTVGDVPPCVVTVDDYTVEYADNVYAGVGRAIVTGKGNYTGVAEKTFVIQKANYDMSHVAWDSVGRFTYDGKQHEVKLQGLPSGVVPTYQGNAATAAGSYVASATLSYDTRNYNPPPSIAPNSWGIDAKGITVSAVDAGSIYGEPDAPLTYNASGLVGSDTLSGAPIRAPGVDVDTYPITIGTLANPNYSITFNPGVYTISPRPVTLTSGSAEKKYDGAPLTNPEVAVSGSGWASGEGATYDVTGSQTEVGESTNTFTYALLPDTKAANYAVTKVEGTLRVLPNPKITDVTAQQRYPWNGRVDISYSLSGAKVETRNLSVWAVDESTGITNVAKSVTGDVAYTNGQHHVVWDMAADGLTLVSTNVVFGVSYAEVPLYCVIDLSGGISATTYPVSGLDAVPPGGWSDEYKTAKLVLRKIKAGTFTMGGRSTDYPGASDDGLHQVTLTKDYWMGVFPVTQRQWELVMGTRPSYFNNDDYYAPRPVESVSYDMIRGSSAGAGWPNSSGVDEASFLGVLRAKSGLQLDLPTEAQWEYACRAGTITALNNGKNLTSEAQDSEMDKVGRYEHNGGSGSWQECGWIHGTAKVGSYAPNPWGLFDMHGNVWEWCLDWYGSYSGDATDPKGSSSGSYRVWRGGSWNYYACYCRSACRRGYYPLRVYFDIGFRLVMTLLGDAETETAAMSDGTGAQGESDPVRIDLTPGTRTTDTTETLTYSTSWVEDAGEDAIVEIADNGVVFSTHVGSGTVAWRPKYDGTYELTHTVKTNGVAMGEALTATFVAEGVSPKCPVISPESGTTFDTSLTVSMTCESEDATIRYTLDGSEPTMASTAYKRKFKIYGITTVKAIAFWEDGTPSEMAVADYSKGYCAEPVVTAPSEFVGSKAKVVMDCVTEGATIYYTMDGTDPNLQSPVYSKPLIVTNDCTIKAYAEKFDFTPSEIVTFVITRQWGIGDTLGKPDHMFETGGDAGFVRVVDETAALGESMRSGAIEDNQRSVLMTTLIGPGTLKFKWKTSCEKDDEYEWDHAEFRVNGIVRGRLNGVSDWVEVSQYIGGKGTNTVTWTYVKDSEEFEGEDCLWVSEYVWESDYTETQTTGVPVPYLWLEEKCSDVVDEFESYEKVAKQKALNKRLTVEQCYVAGVDPESLTQDFTTTITMEGGFPTVTWEPDLGVLREYKIWGRESLMGGDWQYPTNSTHRFFKVTVEMK